MDEQPKPCEVCGAPHDATENSSTWFMWGGRTRWLCRKCSGPAYAKFKAEEEETYP